MEEVIIPTELLTTAGVGSAPLVINYMITTELSVQTTVTGQARNIATVAILYGTLTMWSQTLTQVAPSATVPNQLKIGTITIEAGAEFALTIPTANQNGLIFMTATFVTPTSTIPFAGPVSIWPLSSDDSDDS